MPYHDQTEDMVEMIPSGVSLAVSTPIQRFGSEAGDFRDFEVDDFRAANDSVRAWRHGVRVKNGLGFFCKPPDVQNPLINADYQRLYVDSGVVATLTGGATTSGSPTVTVTSTSKITYYEGYSIRGPGIPANTWIKSIDSATQITLTQNANETLTGQTYYAGEGIGKINTPMSDNMEICASGETGAGGSNRGDKIIIIRGPRTLSDTWKGYIDFWAMIGLMATSEASVSGNGGYENAGAIFFDTNFAVPKYFDGEVWRNVNAPKTKSSTVVMSGTNIPLGTIIESIDSSTQLTMDGNATGSGSVSITFAINGTTIVRTGTVTNGSPIVTITAGNGGTSSLYVGIEDDSNYQMAGFNYFDLENSKFRGYNGSAWVDLG